MRRTAEYINLLVLDPMKEDTGKKYKITASNALCRTYKARGYYKYTDTIDEKIGEACDKGHRILDFHVSGNQMDDDLADFLREHYELVKFEIEIDKTSDLATGEIFYRIRIGW